MSSTSAFRIALLFRICLGAPLCAQSASVVADSIQVSDGYRLPIDPRTVHELGRRYDAGDWPGVREILAGEIERVVGRANGPRRLPDDAVHLVGFTTGQGRLTRVPVFQWSMPFSGGQPPDPYPSTIPGDRPIVLVHILRQDPAPGPRDEISLQISLKPGRTDRSGEIKALAGQLQSALGAIPAGFVEDTSEVRRPGFAIRFDSVPRPIKEGTLELQERVTRWSIGSADTARLTTTWSLDERTHWRVHTLGGVLVNDWGPPRVNDEGNPKPLGRASVGATLNLFPLGYYRSRGPRGVERLSGSFGIVALPAPGLSVGLALDIGWDVNITAAYTVLLVRTLAGSSSADEPEPLDFTFRSRKGWVVGLGIGVG